MENNDSPKVKSNVAGEIADGRPGDDSQDSENAGTSERGGSGREFRERRRQFNSARDLMTEELRSRVGQASEKLKSCLAGTILVEVRDRKERYLLDMTGTPPIVELSDRDTADCVIKLAENTLLKVASGDLNPQIAMLSEKIAVEGKLSLAVYYFNLIAPYSN